MDMPHTRTLYHTMCLPHTINSDTLLISTGISQTCTLYCTMCIQDPPIHAYGSHTYDVLQHLSTAYHPCGNTIHIQYGSHISVVLRIYTDVILLPSMAMTQPRALYYTIYIQETINREQHYSYPRLWLKHTSANI